MKAFPAQPSEKFHSSRKCNTEILSGELLSFRRFFFLSDHYVSHIRVLLVAVPRCINIGFWAGD
jgi:hypothetical protein